jgi:hypothetical protein
MLKLGTIILSEGPKGTEYYIVTETGRRPKLELVEEFIMRNYVVPYDDEICTLKEIINREKRKILSEGHIDV